MEKFQLVPTGGEPGLFSEPFCPLKNKINEKRRKEEKMKENQRKEKS